jgi:RNA polymerase primary sigma factor
VAAKSSKKPVKKPAPAKKPAAKAASAKGAAVKSAAVKKPAKPAAKTAKPSAKEQSRLERFKAAEKAKAEALRKAAAAKAGAKAEVSLNKAGAKAAKADAASAKAVKADAKARKPDAKAAKAEKPEKAKKAAAIAAAPVPVKPLKSGAVKPAPKKPGEAETPGDADSPLLDMSDVGVRKMIAKAKARGYVTYDELNKVLPSDKTSSEQIEDTMAMLNEMGINVIESEEAEEGEEGGALVAEGSKALATTKTGEQYDRTDDPVRMYLREMGSVELLSREGEIAIAKRIEAGRELMIGALCESPLTFEALTVWRDELNEGKVLLRDIIDLEAMYGGGPDAAAAAPADGAEGAAPVVFKPVEF